MRNYTDEYSNQQARRGNGEFSQKHHVANARELNETAKRQAEANKAQAAEAKKLGVEEYTDLFAV